jgi:hypothetical protein
VRDRDSREAAVERAAPVAKHTGNLKSFRRSKWTRASIYMLERISSSGS